MRLFLAIRVFFLVLFSGAIGQRVRQALTAPATPRPAETPAAKPQPKPPSKPVAKPAAPVRSEAITLLATLQREARFVDFIQEPLTGYSDAQIGAVSRQVHHDCHATLTRLFELQPVLDEAEGAAIEIPAGFDAGRFRLTGNVVGEPPFHGKLMHHGWQAVKCQLPAWSGSQAAAQVVAPAEVELS
jgi:hypothetical protein